MIVLDANILIAYGLSDEPLHAQAMQFLKYCAGSITYIHAPQLFRSEITAVMRKAVYVQRLSHSHGSSILANLLVYPIQYHEDDRLLHRAYELADKFNRPRAYDSQYLALAERLNCEFWTADERLFNAVSTQMPTVKWLGTWQTPPTT